MAKTPEEEKLLRYYEENKNDLDGGFLNTMTAFAEDCFKEIMLNDKAKVRDVHKYLNSFSSSGVFAIFYL